MFLKLAFAGLLMTGTTFDTQAQGDAAVARKQAPVTLKVGSDAPPLVAERWFKGKPVDKFEKGHVYIVEFWATWCGPCRASMPHLSAIARKFKNKATVIGFDVRELIAGADQQGDYITKVANFVKNLGDGMDYTVAADVRAGTTWDNWMKAAGLGGIPASFVVDQEGKIAWIGHPANGLEEITALVIDGKLNDGTREEVKTTLAAQNKKSKELKESLDKLKADGETEKAIAVADQLIGSAIFGKSGFITTKFELLSKTQPAKAEKFIREIMKDCADDPLTLQGVGTALMESSKKSDKALGVKVMEQAIARCAPDDPYAHISLASVYYKNGDLKKAVATQERVVAILEDVSLVRQKQTVIDKAKADLETYKNELKK